MSYIRYGQDGTYIDIPEGSNHYIYGNGSDISGWSEAQFAALIGQVVDKTDIPEDEATEIKQGFESHFGGWEPDYRGGIEPPERAEIFCQCVDSRIDSVELTSDLHTAVEEWVAEYDSMVECDHCGEEYRPSIAGADVTVCNKDSCNKAFEAEQFDVDKEVFDKAERVYYHLKDDYGWEYEDAIDAENDYITAHMEE